MDCTSFTAEQCAAITQTMTDGGLLFNQELSDLAVQGCLTMFVTGLGIGLIISIIRKLRSK